MKYSTSLPPQVRERLPKKSERIRDMAAKLLAELFWKQYMIERQQKRQQVGSKDLTRGVPKS